MFTSQPISQFFFLQAIPKKSKVSGLFCPLSTLSFFFVIICLIYRLLELCDYLQRQQTRWKKYKQTAENKFEWLTKTNGLISFLEKSFLVFRVYNWTGIKSLWHLFDDNCAFESWVSHGSFINSKMRNVSSIYSVDHSLSWYYYYPNKRLLLVTREFYSIKFIWRNLYALFSHTLYFHVWKSSHSQSEWRTALSRVEV